MASIQLTDIPKGTDLEEYVAAAFQASGFFVERNIVEKEEGIDILELDIIVSDYQLNSPPEIKLIEVKSSNWGFRDIFKLKGWLEYLEDTFNGYLIVSKKDDHYDILRGKAENKRIGINIVLIEDFENPTKELSKITKKNDIDEIDLGSVKIIV